MTDNAEYSHLNGEILGSVEDQELTEAAQIVFDGESNVVKPKLDKKKRLIYAVIGMAVLLGGGAGVAAWQKQSTHVATVASNDIDLAIAAAAPKTGALPSASAAGNAPVVELPASGSFAAQTVGAVDNKPLSPVAALPSSIIPAAPAQKAAVLDTRDHNAIAPLVISKPNNEEQIASLATAQQGNRNKQQPIAEKKQLRRVEPSLKESMIVVRNKQVQSVPMRNLGVVAILTDGLIIKKGGEDVEISIGEAMPGLGVLQKTNPKDRTIETDQRIYKLN